MNPFFPGPFGAASSTRKTDGSCAPGKPNTAPVGPGKSLLAMKIKPNPKGVYYAHLTGSNPINLKTRSRAEAVRLARASKLEELEFAAKAKLLTAEAVQRLTVGGKVTGEQALARWRTVCELKGLSPSTINGYEGHLRRFLSEARLSDSPVIAATIEQLDHFVNAPDAAHAGTRHNRRAALDSFFAVCAAEGYLLGNPASVVRVKYHGLTFEQKEPRQRAPFTAAELRLLQRADLSVFWRTAVFLSLEYGLRLSDVAQLEWDSFARADAVVIWTDKRDRRLELPRVAGLDAVLAEVPRRNSRRLFPGEHALMGDPTRRATLSVYFGRILERLGITGKSFHCLRHTFATRRAALGDTVDQIRLKMGHVSSVTTERYIHA